MPATGPSAGHGECACQDGGKPLWNAQVLNGVDAFPDPNAAAGECGDGSPCAWLVSILGVGGVLEARRA